MHAQTRGKNMRRRRRKEGKNKKRTKREQKENKKRTKREQKKKQKLQKKIEISVEKRERCIISPSVLYTQTDIGIVTQKRARKIQHTQNRKFYRNAFIGLIKDLVQFVPVVIII
jgi:predicted RecB family nuclease